MNDSPWLKPSEVAQITDSSVRTVQQWCDEGRIRAIRVRRVWRIHSNAVGIAGSSLPARSTFRICEVATWLRVSPRTVRRLIADGELQTTTVRGQRRIARGVVLTYIEKASDLEAA